MNTENTEGTEMSGEEIYFRAAGRSLEIVEEFCAEESASRLEIMEYRDSIGADSIHVSNTFGGVAGVGFKGPAPAGWREDRKLGLYVPAVSTAAGKRVRAELANLRTPTARDLARRLGVKVGFGGGGRFHDGVGLEKVGADWIISKFDYQPGDPPDAIRLKNSEYWTLVEAHKAAKAQEAVAP